jgi:SAM-dependent methyltransferase
MNRRDEDTIREAVRDRYGRIAEDGAASGCCTPDSNDDGSGCCGPTKTVSDVSKQLGYSDDELAAAPEGANLGLGCGNPQAIAALRPNEVVLDLGSGAGFDCFLAARAVGGGGHVIGVDMTQKMIDKARHNADAAGVENVEFRLGEIEALPVEADTVDVIISNCVINLSPDKPAVYREAFRVLKPGGRIAISDVVATAELPPEVRGDLAMYTGCVAGASSIDELEATLHEAGFADVRVTIKGEKRNVIRQWAPGASLDDYIASANIEAVKPRHRA